MENSARRIRYTGVIVVLLAGMGMAPSLQAEQWAAFDESPPAPMVLTPARVSQHQGEVPASVTVIDRQLIVASGARELFEVLRLVPGMSVGKTDGNVPAVSYHGTQSRDPRRMLVLIDGRSQYQPGFARVSWNDLPVDVADIERIEVTRGPAAAAYGANAFSGVINIITRDARDISENVVTGRSGNNGVGDARLMLHGRQVNSAWNLSLSHLQDDGFDSLSGDRKRRQALNSEWVQELAPSHTLIARFGGSQRVQQRDGEGDDLAELGELTRKPEQTAESLFASLQWQANLAPDHQLKLTAYSQYSEQVTDFRVCYTDPLTGQPGPGGGVLFSRELRELFLANDGDIDQTLAAAPGDPGVQQRYMTLVTGADGVPFCAAGELDSREARYDIELQDTWQIHPRLRLVSGANLRHDRAHSNTFLSGAADNTSYRLFANLTADILDPLMLNVGGFWERDSISDDSFSPRLGLNWQLSPGHYLRYVYSRAQRNPDIYEDQAHINLRARQLRPPYQGNTEALLGWSTPQLFVTQQSPGTLTPEKIESQEVGYFGQFYGMELDVRVFREHLTNLVSGALNPFNFQPGNDGEVKMRGYETQLSWRPHRDHLLRFTTAFIDSETEQRPERRFTPRRSGTALWHWQMSPQWGFASVYHRVRSYNGRPFLRLDKQIQFQHGLGQHRMRWQLAYQRSLNEEEIVTRGQNYNGDHYWLTASVAF